MKNHDTTLCQGKECGLGVMVLNATFNNISVISCRSILLVEQNGVPAEKHRPVASHKQTLSHKVYRVHLTMSRIWTHNDSGESIINPTITTPTQLSYDHNAHSTIIRSQRPLKGCVLHICFIHINNYTGFVFNLQFSLFVRNMIISLMYKL